MQSARRHDFENGCERGRAGERSGVARRQAGGRNDGRAGIVSAGEGGDAFVMDAIQLNTTPPRRHVHGCGWSLASGRRRERTKAAPRDDRVNEASTKT